MDTRGKYTYRLRAFQAYPLECARCGFRKDDRLLDVHHKDGNHNNAGLDNLEILCVMCHARETRKNWAHFVKAEIPEF
jgi:5-methylcytosine-specific restriction endonuclease McrA